MLSSELFDTEVMRQAQAPFVLLDELRQGWDGALDIILYFRDEDFPSVKGLVAEMGLTAPREGNWLRSPISATRGCRQPQVEELRELLKPYRYVGVLSYDDFALQTHKLAGTLLMDCGADLCCLAYKERSVLLRQSPRVVALADNFIRKNLAVGGPFLAGHIRPMPDDCVTLWQSPQEELDEKDLTDTCRTDYMYKRFVPNLQYLQRTYGTNSVFIMTHPFIRPRVFRMLEAGGIRPVYIDITHLNASIAAAPEPLRTPLSFSLLAVVEEAVAAAATAFLGTGESSMTGMIVQERLARGFSQDTIYFMSPHRNCTLEPCKLADYYTRREERLRKRAASGLRTNLVLPKH